MAKYKAIPEGYMTVGEAARKMGGTVRTLQYYNSPVCSKSVSRQDLSSALWTIKSAAFI